MKAARLIVGFSVLAGVIATLIQAAGGSSRPRATVKTRPFGPVLDLNTATPDQLKRLGLDELAIQRLVENRPYHHKLELVSRLVLPRTIYGRIRHYVDVRRHPPSKAA